MNDRIITAIRDLDAGTRPRDARRQGSYELLAELLSEGWAVVGRRPGWYYRLTKPPAMVIVPTNPDAFDYQLLMDVARRRLETS